MLSSFLHSYLLVFLYLVLQLLYDGLSSCFLILALCCVFISTLRLSSSDACLLGDWSELAPDLGWAPFIRSC